MTQLELNAPLTRFSDPSSSHLAASEQIASGRQNDHARAVLAVILDQPGLTYREIARRLPHLEPVEVMRRLNDLTHCGLAERGEQRECSQSGRKALTWWSTEGR